MASALQWYLYNHLESIDKVYYQNCTNDSEFNWFRWKVDFTSHNIINVI